jgi:hypothetical protein
VGGNFAENVAGDDAHVFCCLKESGQVYRVAKVIRIGLAVDFVMTGARQLGRGIGQSIFSGART